MENILETSVVETYIEFHKKFGGVPIAEGELNSDALKFSSDLAKNNIQSSFKISDIATLKVEVENHPSIASLIFSYPQINAHSKWCELCQMDSIFSDDTPYGTCQCS